MGTFVDTAIIFPSEKAEVGGISTNQVVRRSSTSKRKWRGNVRILDLEEAKIFAAFALIRRCSGQAMNEGGRCYKPSVKGT